MDCNIEHIFVENFIVGKMKGRFLFELCGKKRDKALSRIAHNAESILETKYIININNQNELLKYVSNEIQTADKVYIIGGIYDGKELPVVEAIQRTFEQSDSSILIFSKNLAFHKTENEGGTANQYLLRKT